MKTKYFSFLALETNSLHAAVRASIFVIVLSATALRPLPVGATETGKVFATASEAATALGRAANEADYSKFALLFGSDSEWVTNSDAVQSARELAQFADAFNATNRLVQNSETRMTLEVGTNGWPFPIPLVKTDSGWRFDTAEGRDHILSRRIGHNELSVLADMRAYVQAQREYASQDHDGDGVLEYAQKIASSPGETDGLYWPTELNGEISPLGPQFAHAQSEGYFAEKPAAGDGPQPFHGYFFKTLKRQGKHAPGGKYDYVINGNMIGGFALVAWPSDYGESGVMTFIVNQQGRVYQKDLGKETGKIAPALKDYDPDETWSLSSD